MARNFGSGFGTGTTDEIVTGYTTSLTGQQRSYSIWLYDANTGSTGGGNARAFDKRTVSAQTELFFFGTPGPIMSYEVDWTTTAGNWETPAFTQNVWNHWVITYDSGAVGNIPLIYLNGVSQSLTIQSTPTGTLPASNSDGYVIGNRGNDQLRNWTGSIAEFAIWNGALLTQTEVSALAKGARPWTIRKGSLVGYWPLDGLASPEPDLSGNKGNGTVTGALPALIGPPLMMMTPRWAQFNFPFQPVFVLMPQIVT
jgi:hypothetical protein